MSPRYARPGWAGWGWRTLNAQAPMPVGQLAQEVLSLQPTVTKWVQRLTTQGWVRWRDDPADQRRSLVQITPAGQRKITPLIKQARVHEARVLADLDAAKVRHLKDRLRNPTRLR